VFGVVFAALFLVGFLFMAIVLADANKPGDCGQTASTRNLAAIVPSASAPKAAGTIAANAGDSMANSQRNSLDAARGSALDQFRSAGRDVKQARERLRAAELALFQYLYAQLCEAVAPAQHDSPAVPATSPAVSVTAPQESKEIQNPQVAELERQLVQAQQQKAKLLERLMPSHPNVQNIELTIADLQTRLQTAQQTKIIEPAPGVLQLPTIDVPGDGGVAPNSSILAKARDLMQAAGRAQRDYDAAVEEESSCWAAYEKLPNVMVLNGHAGPSLADPSASESTPSAVAEADSSAHRSIFGFSRQPLRSDSIAPRPVIPLSIVIMLAFAAALIAAYNARYRLPTFANVDEIETRLGVSVLGRLAWAGLPAAAMPSALAEPRWLRRSVAIGEIALAVAIAAIALLAIADFALARQLAADPLTGIVQAIAKLHG
jgi:hypothetical protein